MVIGESIHLTQMVICQWNVEIFELSMLGKKYFWSMVIGPLKIECLVK